MEVPVIFGEWWRADTEAVLSQALQTGGPPNVSDAFTINGLPGPLYNCSAKDTCFVVGGTRETYMLRLINAALDDEFFFSVPNHTLTIVEVDAVYVKPFTVKTLIISPGQTANVLLTTKPLYPKANFYMLAAFYLGYQNPRDPLRPSTINNTTAAGILEYQNPGSPSAPSSDEDLPLFKPTLPRFNDTGFVANFASKLRSLVTPQYPAAVQWSVDKKFFFTVGMGTFPCPMDTACQGPINGTRFVAAVNNVSFVLPSMALLLFF
uniref:laccase n=1 Tax=Triticum urartu TaxID=4572 RepID=A0A8R7U9R9_TRIUA